MDKSKHFGLAGALVEMICAEVLVESAVFEHVVGGGEESGGHGAGARTKEESWKFFTHIAPAWMYIKTRW